MRNSSESALICVIKLSPPELRRQPAPSEGFSGPLLELETHRGGQRSGQRACLRLFAIASPSHLTAAPAQSPRSCHAFSPLGCRFRGANTATSIFCTANSCRAPRRRFQQGKLTRNAALPLDGSPRVASGPGGAFPRASRAPFMCQNGRSNPRALALFAP